MAMDPIISQVAAYLPGGAELITELESTTDEERIQEIYGIILTTMADQCLTTPLVYPHQLAVYSDKIANYDFPPDANFTAVQNITLKVSISLFRKRRAMFCIARRLQKEK